MKPVMLILSGVVAVACLLLGMAWLNSGKEDFRNACHANNGEVITYSQRSMACVKDGKIIEVFE